jgi:hypothetical protein
MNAFELQDLLLDSLWDNDGLLYDDPIRSIRTFQDVGMLSRDAGLVITTSDGSVSVDHREEQVSKANARAIAKKQGFVVIGAKRVLLCGC